MDQRLSLHVESVRNNRVDIQYAPFQTGLRCNRLIVYGSARKSYLHMLDPIQNQALHLCLDAFRTSTATSLHVEANEMPMELRRRLLASQYSLKIRSNLSNPARNCAFKERFTKLFDKRPNQIRPLGLRIKTDLSAIGFKHLSLLVHHGCLNHHPSIYL